jgi:hypothetical protein
MNDPQHWQARAAEARALAGLLQDPEARRAMMEIARSYEQIAKRAEQGRSQRM